MVQSSSAAVANGLAWFDETFEDVLAETEQVCRIPAPTFAEAERAAYVAERMHSIGLEDVQTDSIHNVTGVLRGDRRDGQTGPTTLVAAHIDTVFPHGTPLETRRTSQRLYGPSIGDNSVAVAALLSVATAMRQLQPFPSGQVIFAANVGEEGLGDLSGIRALLNTWDNQLDTVIAVEGHGLDEVRTAGIGSTRLEISFEGHGGHSWGAFGTPSAIHAMGDVIHKISRLKVPDKPKTTYNVGLVEGGNSVNTIAPRASIIIDLRSVDTIYLEWLEAKIERILNQVCQDTGIAITSRIVGQRPAAALDPQHPLCQQIKKIRAQLRLRPPLFSASSTDANLPLSLGIPAFCLGITRGGQAHTVKEYIDIDPIHLGLKQLYLAILNTLEP